MKSLQRRLSNPTSALVPVAVCCFVLTLLLALRSKTLDPSDTALWANPYDHHKYVYMAGQPLGSFHINPACWRITVPFLVGHLPTNIITGFKAQSLFFVTATGILLFWFLHRVAGYKLEEAVLGVMLYYSYGPATKLLLQGPYSPDP